MRVLYRAAALGVVVFTLSAFSGQAFAQLALWDHNGSLMRLDRKEKKRRIVYQEPRKALESAGVKSGTILFEGEEKKNGRLAGYAKLFRSGCEPVDYFVEGAYDKVEGRIVLQGQAPIYSGDGCKITGYTDNGSASTLKFTRQGPAPEQVVAAPIEPDTNVPPSAVPDTEPSNPVSRSRHADRTYPPPPPAYQRDPDFGYDEADEDPRSYAYQGEPEVRRRRYDGTYYSPPAVEDEEEYGYEVYEDEEDEEPAYVPYQPRWRRHVY